MLDLELLQSVFGTIHETLELIQFLVKQTRRWRERRRNNHNARKFTHQSTFTNTSGETLVDVLIGEISLDGEWNVLGYAHVLPQGESLKVWAGGRFNKNNILVVSYRGAEGREVMLLSGWAGDN